MELKKFETNIKSQFGEDGIIKEIFNLIGTSNKICVEFGAWDGIHFSNTWTLWHNEGWEALLIEGDSEKYQTLIANTSAFSNVKPYMAYVMPDGPNSLDEIFKKYNYPVNIDLLSIDIDGDDYYIFDGLKNYCPRLIVIEYNPTIPPSVELIQQKGEYFGASALSILKLAHKKGYKLVHVTETNLFLVNNEDFDKLGKKEKPLADLFLNKHMASIVSSYDGKTFLVGELHYAHVNMNSKVPATYPELVNPNHVPIQTVVLRPSINKTFIGSAVNLVKRILKRTPVYSVRLNILKKENYKKSVEKWKAAGRPVPPPQAVKHLAIKYYARKYGVLNFVETGTYYGETTEICKPVFKTLSTIELDDTLYELAVKKFAKDKKITVYHGDSGDVIKDLLKEIKEKTLFWLDGHYSAGVTAKGELNTPIIKELTYIFDHPIKDHVILVDDARCFIGEDDYPTIAFLKDFVKKHDKTLNFEVENDIIRIFH
jgi:hypothetical protein